MKYHQKFIKPKMYQRFLRGIIYEFKDAMHKTDVSFVINECNKIKQKKLKYINFNHFNILENTALIIMLKFHMNNLIIC